MLNKKIFALTVLVVLVVALMPVYAWATTVCSHPIYPSVDIEKSGHWVTLEFYISTKSLQVSKRFSKFVYLQVNGDDLKRVGLRYHEYEPLKLPYFLSRLYEVPRNGKLFLEDRRLWLVDGTYRMNITYYVCGIHEVQGSLVVKGDTATITLIPEK